MKAKIPQSEGVRYPEISIREHDRFQLVVSIAAVDVFGAIRAYGHNLNIAFIKLRPKFLPSPQLGDTVRSPVSPKEFHEDRLTTQARRIE